MHIYICTHVNIYIFVNIHIYISNLLSCMHMYICECVYMCVCMCVCVRVCVYTLYIPTPTPTPTPIPKTALTHTTPTTPLTHLSRFASRHIAQLTIRLRTSSPLLTRHFVNFLQIRGSWHAPFSLNDSPRLFPTQDPCFHTCPHALSLLQLPGTCFPPQGLSR